MAWHLVTENTVTAFPAEAWEGLAGDTTLMMSRGWLAASERDRGIDPYYFAVMDGSRILGALPCYIDAHGRHARYQPRAMLPLAVPDGEPWLIGGSAAGYESGILLADDLPDSMRADVLHHLLAAAAQLARTAGAPGIAFSYLPGTDVTLLRALHPDWTAWEGHGKAVIRLPQGGFDAYLATLSAHRRNAVRRERKTFANVGYILRQTRLSEAADVMGRLAANVESKYGAAIDPDVVLSSLRRQAAGLDDRSTVTTCACPDGTVIGCCLFYQWGSTLYARMAGFDYPRLAHAFEYMNLVIYQGIDIAYRSGCTELHLGMGSYEVKAGRGADIVSTWWLLLDATGVPYRGDQEETVSGVGR